MQFCDLAFRISLFKLLFISVVVYLGQDLFFFHLHTACFKLTAGRGCGTKAYGFTVLAGCTSFR